MPRFSYNAIDHRHKSARGVVTAESAYAARKHLRGRGLHPTNIRELSSERERGSLLGFMQHTNRGQIVEFTRQLAIMLNAGIKLTDALGVLVNQISDTRLRNAIGEIRDRVVTGESLAEAMAEYEGMFDVIFISMVRVGEMTGTLAQSLNTMAVFMERRQKIESKFKTAMIYPVFLFLGSLAAIIFVTTWTIPKIATQIEKAGQELPGITKAMMVLSEVLTSWKVFVVIGVIAGAIWLFRKLIRTDRGAVLKDKFLLRIPLFGPLLKQRIVARFTSTLSTLLGAGLSMAESLKVVAEVTGNKIMHHAVTQARDRILSGSDIATPLRESGVIDPAIAHMVTIGEKSGELEIMLRTISDNLESSSEVVIDRMTALIEPAIILFMALMIGLVALATLLPIIRFSAGQM